MSINSGVLWVRWGILIFGWGGFEGRDNIFSYDAFLWSRSMAIFQKIKVKLFKIWGSRFFFFRELILRLRWCFFRYRWPSQYWWISKSKVKLFYDRATLSKIKLKTFSRSRRFFFSFSWLNFQLFRWPFFCQLHSIF